MKKVLITLAAVLTLMSCSKEEMTDTVDLNLNVSELALSVSYWETKETEYLDFSFKRDSETIKVSQVLLQDGCVYFGDDSNITAISISDEAITLNYGPQITLSFTIAGESLKLTINAGGEYYSEVMVANDTLPCDEW